MERINAYGPTYTTAFVDILVKDVNSGTDITSIYGAMDHPTGDQEDIYNDLYQVVYDHLVIMEGRIGNRFGYPSSAPGDPLNVELIGTPESRKNRIINLMTQYLNSFPGEDEEAPENVTMQLLISNHPAASWFSEEIMEQFLPILKYRLSSMKAADELIERFGLNAPDGKSCAEFNLSPLQGNYSMRKRISDMSRLLDISGCTMILPQAYYYKQGYCFDKPYSYLAVAFLDSGLELEKIQEMVTAEAHRVEEDLKLAALDMRKMDPFLEGCRQAMFESFGIAVGNLCLEQLWLV